MKKKDAVLLALQLVFEYPGWGNEHVEDMIRTYKETGEKAPCTADELGDLAVKAQRLKDQKMTFEQVEAAMLKKGVANG